MELLVNDDYRRMMCDFYLREQRGSRFAVIWYDGENMVEKVFDENSSFKPLDEFKPLLSIPIMMKDALLRSFVDAAKNIKIKTEDENLLKGKLEAQESHLKDLQELIKTLILKK